jgi:hypothetical protein
LKYKSQLEQNNCGHSIPQVFIHDPWRGNLTIPYEKVKAAYGEGDWKWSWRNIKK